MIHKLINIPSVILFALRLFTCDYRLENLQSSRGVESFVFLSDQNEETGLY